MRAKMKKLGFQLLASQIVGCVERQMRHVVAYGDMVATNAEQRASPIESLFNQALHLCVRFDEQEWFDYVIPIGSELTLDQMQQQPHFRECIFVARQAQLTDWRVDFLIRAYGDWAREKAGGLEGWRSLIVECDGHEFHERTKEQAAKDRGRDRWAQENGFDIFRFTGSELWRDPLGCARQVVQWANRAV